MILEQISGNIIRLRAANTQSLSERYGIVQVPPAIGPLQAGKDYKMQNGMLHLFLSDNLTIQIQLRPQTDDTQWKNYADSFQTYFSNYQLNYKIKGRPDAIKSADYNLQTAAKEHGKNRQFGLKIAIQPKEAFYGMGEAVKDRLNLRGGEYQNWATYQFDEIPIPFVMSNAGWGMFFNVNGRHFVDIGKRDANSMIVLGNEDDLDVFFFRGEKLEDLIRCYTSLTGGIMLLPKWAYGLTYIPSILKNQVEVLDDAQRLRQDHIPCDHISLEPQWMETFYDYSLERNWDLKKFHMMDCINEPDRPEFGETGRKGKYSFINALRRYGFHTSLWLCNSYDFTDEAERIAQKKEKGLLEPWYAHLSKFVNQGIDGFKIDPADTLDTNRPEMVCANGYSEVEMHNLSQVLMPMQVYQGMAQQLRQRPMLHYCGGYAGIQRWCAANTGDNGGLKGSLLWMLGLGLSGHSNTTVDMDIHYKESMHFAMFAPWAHLNAWLGCSEPWWETPEMYQIFKDYAQLRYRLIPYIYSAALETYETAMPILRAMPLAFPDNSKVQNLAEQYLFGPSLMLQCYSDVVVLPQGEWIDWWTHQRFEGNIEMTYCPPENRGGGLFIRGGAIIPMWENRDYMDQKSEEHIILEIWPCGDSCYTFREDDGESLDYLTQPCCKTEIYCKEQAQEVWITIGDRVGDYCGKPKVRRWTVRVHTTKTVKICCASQDIVKVEEI